MSSNSVWSKASARSEPNKLLIFLNISLLASASCLLYSFMAHLEMSQLFLNIDTNVKHSVAKCLSAIDPPGWLLLWIYDFNLNKSAK